MKKNQLISLVITILFLSSCKTVEVIRTETVADSTAIVFYKEQLKQQEQQLSELKRELKEASKEIVRMQSETNTAIERYDTASNVIERIIINNKEVSDSEKYYYKELYEFMLAEYSRLSEQLNDLTTQTETHVQIANSTDKNVKKTNWWERITNLSFWILLAITTFYIIYILLKKKILK